jgi:hypothetical protein
MVLQIFSLVVQTKKVHANGFFDNTLVERLLTGCASMFRPFPVTSIGGSVNEQIPSQLPRVRSLHVSFLRRHSQAVPFPQAKFPKKLYGTRSPSNRDNGRVATEETQLPNRLNDFSVDPRDQPYCGSTCC